MLVALATLVPLEGEGARAPTEFRVWAFGKVRTSKGDFLFDAKAARSVMTAYRDQGNRLTFDYQHLATSPNARAGDGKSAGSCLLELRADGLYVTDCRWTPRASTEIADREWLYTSPTFEADTKTGRILRLLNIALTNVPATKRMAPLVAAQMETLMPGKATATIKTDSAGPAALDDESLAKAYASKYKTSRDRLAKAEAELAAAKAEHEHISSFGRPADADPAPDAPADAPEAEAAAVPPAPKPKTAEPQAKTPAPPPSSGDLPDTEDDDDEEEEPIAKKPPPKAAEASVAASRSVMGPADASIARVACEVTGHTHPSEVVGALRALAVEAKKAKALASEVVSLSTELRQTRVTRMVNKAVREMRLEPRKKEWALNYGMKDEKALETYLATCSAVTTSETTRHEPDPRASEAALTRLEQQMIERLGVNPADWRKQKQANETRLQRAAAAADDED